MALPTELPPTHARPWPSPLLVLEKVAKKLKGSLPAITLGILLNTLDAASTGLLIFPGDGSFGELQMQGMAIYLMSTIMCQLALTLGGSRFPGSMGSMLIEILPFLRGIATDISKSLGHGNPALIPTVMAAYALTSFLVGGCFLILGLLRLGWIVCTKALILLVLTILAERAAN